MLHFFGLEVLECCLWISNKGKPQPMLCHLIETSSVLLTTPWGQGRGRTVIPGFAVQYISIMLPSQTRHLMCQSQTVVLPSPLPLFLHMLGGLPEKRVPKSLPYYTSFIKGHPHPYYTPKLQASAQRRRSCLLLAGSKISLSPPVSILIDSLFPSRKRRPLLCCILWSSALELELLPFSDSRDLTLISDFNVSSRFWAAHLVSSAITAGSPCGCSAAYSPYFM